MKLAEALIERSELQRKLSQLEKRLTTNSIIQEGEEPFENPKDLLNELNTITKNLTKIIQKINKTNNTTIFDEGTLSDALAKRETTMNKIRILAKFLTDVSSVKDRYSYAEIKTLPTVSISDLQKLIDEVSKEFRILDTKIQEKNWQIDLI